MFVQTEETPNPRTLKFLPGQPVIGDGAPRDFPDERMAEASPLARALFRIPGVCAVFFGADFISVSKEDSSRFSWAQLKPDILGAIAEHFASQAPLLTEENLGADGAGAADAPKAPQSEEARQILEILETRIRPAVQQDGGDIIFERYEEGVLTLRLRGACSGCPSAEATLKQGVENLLRYYVPAIREVRATEETGETP